MNIDQCYKILQISHSASDEEITRSFKKLAHKYHPDKNQDKIEWANDAMTMLNRAYSAIMEFRFTNENNQPQKESPKKQKAQNEKPPQQHQTRQTDLNKETLEEEREILINRFVSLRENAKDSLYQFFQYNLNSIPIRDKASNTALYNRIVSSLRKNYHAINTLGKKTNDSELLEHFSIFNNMIFNFYRAAECLNIIDSYSSQYEVNSYRLFKEGDETLHLANKELFFDRHNRGTFKKSAVLDQLALAQKLFSINLSTYPDSSWKVETSIKLDYVHSLLQYVTLFFSDD